MQTQNRILQATVVLMALFITIAVVEAQTKKTKKKTAAAPLKPTDLSIEILDTSVAVLDSNPSVDEFVSVEVEPYPVQNIQSLVEYPEKAKRAGLEGKVILSALIDTNGNVIKVEIDRSDNPIFEESARKAIMKAQFKPALQNGKPVKLWYTLPIMYKLKNNYDSTTPDIFIGAGSGRDDLREFKIIPPFSTEYKRQYDNVKVDAEPQPLQDIYSLVEYPEEAKKAGLEGRVVVYALIDTSEKVIQVETDSSGYTILEESAKKAMLKVQFTPAIKDGKAMQYWYTMPVLFKPYTIDK